VKTKEVESALVCHHRRSPFHFVTYIVVPNLSHGMFNYEIDLLALSKSNWAHEIEIKISKSDLIADKKKQHGHHDSQNRIRCLWFAGPEKLEQAFIEHAPERAGIIIITPRGYCLTIRKPKIQTNSRKFTDEERMKLMRLAYMRFWGKQTKRALNRRNNEIHNRH